MSTFKDFRKLSCLMCYLDRLPMEGVPLGERIQIAFHISCEIDRAMDKLGLTDLETVVAAVRRRIHPHVLMLIEMARGREDDNASNVEVVEVANG